VVSAVNNHNKTLVDDAAAKLLRDPYVSNNGAPAGAATAPDEITASTSRGPAVQVTVSALADVAMRLQALNAPTDDTATALANQLQQNNDALNTLDTARKSTAQDRKKEAEQKLERARKALQLLQILGGDPASQARQAKEIGKKIKDAAGEYNTALKDEAGGSAASPFPANDPATKAADADATTAATEVLRIAEDPGAATAPTDRRPASAASIGSDTTRHQAIGAQSPADSAAAKATAYKLGQHDRDVLALFRDAANQVKHVLDDAAKRAKANNAADPRDRQTGRELDKAVGDLAVTIQIKQSGGDVSTPPGRDSHSAPAPVDILA
jgi:hypothetical protein